MPPKKKMPEGHSTMSDEEHRRMMKAQADRKYKAKRRAAKKAR